jgi:MFS transporter, MCT family, solute carrier family 16 (monocarboxylic acid transporters), member 10
MHSLFLYVNIPSTVFLAAYLKDPRYAQQKHASSLLPLIGTLCMGTMYCTGRYPLHPRIPVHLRLCAGLVMYPLIAKFPFIRRQLAWAGAIICWASLFGASYVHDVSITTNSSHH